MTIRPHDDYERFTAVSVLGELPVSRWCASCHALARDRHHIFREINGVRRPEAVKDEHLGIWFHNIMPLCRHCHNDLTGGVGGHKAQLFYDADQSPPMWLWIATSTREVLFEVPVAVLSEGDKGVKTTPGTTTDERVEPLSDVSPPSESAVDWNRVPGNWREEGDSWVAGAVEEGQDCPTCKRRVPHKHKRTSPKTTKQMNLGPAPADAVDELKVRLDDLAEEWGIKDKPHHRVKVVDVALDVIAQVDRETMLEIVTKRPWAA